MILEMIEEQVNSAVDRFMDPDYGAESFREFASNRLGVEFEEGEFRSVTDFASAEQIARDKATRFIPTVIQEGIDENLSTEEDEKDWKWQEMTRLVNAKYGLSSRTPTSRRSAARTCRNSCSNTRPRRSTKSICPRASSFSIAPGASVRCATGRTPSSAST